MRVQTKIKLAGVACLAALLPMLMGPTGGLPSQPQFQSVGIGTPASGLGNLAITGTMTQGTVPAARISPALAASASTDTTNASNISSGTLADARLSSNIPLKNASNTFSAQQSVIVAGGNNFVVQTNNTSFAEVIAQDGSTANGILLCMSDSANICGSSIPASDAVLRWTSTSGVTSLHFDGGTLGNIDEATLSSTGVFNVKSGGDVQINAVSVCRSDGTNCPAAALTQTTGSFTSTLSTGCTTTPSATLTWVKTGNVVTLSTRGTGLPYANCTSNSTDRQTDASLPASIRPAVSLVGGTITVNDNSVSVVGCINVLSTGALRWGRVPAAGTSCGPPNMTNSGTTGIDGFTISYLIN